MAPEIAFLLSVVQGLALLALLLLSSSAACAAGSTLTRGQGGQDMVTAASFVLGPMAMSWVLTYIMTLIPGRAPLFYITACGLLFGAPGLVYLPRFIKRLWSGCARHIRSYRDTPLSALLAMIAVGALALGLMQLVAAHLIAPLWGNDPLEYAAAARYIAETRDAGEYPIVDSDRAGGMLAHWTHPMGYVTLMVLGYFFQGADENTTVVRLIAPYFAFAQATALMTFAARGRPLAGPLAGVILLFTPLYYQLAIQAHIDTLRLAAFSTAIFLTWRLAQFPSLGGAVLAGIAAGLSGFSHSIGVLTIFFAAPLYVLTSRAKLSTQAIHVAVMAVLAIGVIAPHLLKNLQVFGSLLQDSVEVWEIPELHVDSHLEIERYLYTPADKFVNGAFAGFSNIGLFTWVYWVALIGLVLALAAHLRANGLWRSLTNRTWMTGDPGVAAMIVVLGFYAFVFLTMAIGSDLAIKNVRYTGTIQPLIAAAAACMLVWALGGGRTPFALEGAETRTA